MPCGAKVVSMMARMLIGLASLAFLLSGCAGDSGGAAKLDFEGEDTGTHTEKADGCDDDGTLTGSGHIDDGVLTVTVMDGSGKELFSRDYEGEVNLAAERLTGSSGDWTLSAVRMGDDVVGDEFKGEYAFNLSC